MSLSPRLLGPMLAVAVATLALSPVLSLRIFPKRRAGAAARPFAPGTPSLWLDSGDPRHESAAPTLDSMMPSEASHRENQTDTQTETKIHGKTALADPDKYTRLSVNLSLDTAAVLKQLATRKGITITDAIRRAIAVWSFVEDELDKGNRIAVVERVNGNERVREVVFVSH
jgi:hypothetical protein